MEIAANAKIVKDGNAWLVPSQSLNGKYRVTMESDNLRCTCPDFELRSKPCKHIFAAGYFVQRQTIVETTNRKGETVKTTVTETAAAVRVSYPQNWPAYNAAQTQEKAMFCTLLRDLTASVPEPEQVTGRPRIPMSDAIFSACFKVYSTVSSRRFMTDLRDAHEAGHVSRAWHYNTVLKVIEDKSITPALYDLVTASAAPLKAVEDTFAVDSTGFGTQSFYRHFSAKYGHDQYSRNFVKLHALIGTKTNVIASARVTDRLAHDSPEFVPLIADGAENFAMKTVVADKAYNSRENVNAVAYWGAEPLIPFRSTARLNARQVTTTPAWSKLWHLYNYRQAEFLSHYHARSNAESTFSSIKRVFGDTLRSKTPEAQENELLLKVIAHNIVCVIHSIFELGIEMPFCPQTAMAAHNVDN